jgi:BolA protein
MTEKITKDMLIEQRLRKALHIDFLQIKNESAKHAGHAGDNGSGESHYVITISAQELNALPRLQRHRKVLEILGPNITKETHSISLNIR